MSVRVAALQSEIVWEDPEANFTRLDPWIERAAAHGARLLVLPEMFACGFTMDTARVAEPVDGPSTTFLVERAARHDLWLAGSVPELPSGDGRPANTLLLVSPTG
ncbi:MAG: nitrilase-related carbon-nitrogen hydrolase, partial [Acidobacteriota bacterium]